eukprot:scaffold1618_cov397-Prasinococcus_capsulatus_cf.AAC.21
MEITTTRPTTKGKATTNREKSMRRKSRSCPKRWQLRGRGTPGPTLVHLWTVWIICDVSGTPRAAATLSVRASGVASSGEFLAVVSRWEAARTPSIAQAAPPAVDVGQADKREPSKHVRCSAFQTTPIDTI